MNSLQQNKETSKEKLEQINKKLRGEKDWYVNKINALKESALKEESETISDRNRNDKRYEEPFEDESAPDDDCD